MSDLEDDLLALAGDGVSDSEFEPQDFKKRSSPTNSSTKRRKTTVRDFDDEIDEDEEVGEDDDQIKDYEDEDEDDDEEDNLVNPYPLEGKYRDEEDRENLLKMDEIQREQTLFDRSQEMESYNEKKYLQQRLKQQKAQAEGAKDKKTRTSARSKMVKSTSKSNKLDKLSELRKQRDQKSRRESKRKDYDDYEEDEEDEEEDEGEEELEEDEEDEYGYNDYEDKVVWGSGASSSRSSRVKRSTERAQFENLSQIKVGRSMLHRFCFYSNFSDAVIDCFARINVGIDKRTRRPIYRMVQIVDVKNIPEKAYKFPSTMVDIYLTVAQNRTQKKDFPMTVFSDSPITREEFDRYVIELNKTDEELPYLDDVKEKINVLNQFMNREISDKDVNEMIKRKQQLNASTGDGQNLEGFDAVFQKSRIRDELKVAKQEKNFSKISKLEKKLEDLEVIVANTTNKVTSGGLTMSKVNERNRKLNQTNIRIAELKSSQLKKIAEATSDGGDPFSRFKTNTRMFYQDLVNEENEKALVDARINYEKEMAEKTEMDAKIASSSYRSLGVMDDLIKNIELDIEIKI
ncbi:RNA polymerase-associated protein Rtf1p [[Candida] railenensis]|uniref:RNA polymerase-associated protein Rtf1p n=1 Tax=[Candida] railenensis TaxID=45579 RepID=A0A9P0QV77_9ASCO|nr:RNA polymerase-associated protein Rtf1p [[Candida] railenensis]